MIIQPGKGQLARNIRTALITYINTLRKIRGLRPMTKYTNEDLNKALHAVGLDRDNRRTFVQKVSSLIKEWETTADHPNDKKRHPVTDWHLKQVKQRGPSNI